MSEIASLK